MDHGRFQRYVGIDYSGAATPQKGLPGIRVFEATPYARAREIRPEENSHRHWSRATLHRWLSHSLAQNEPTLVGIDHGFSFPEEYFQAHDLPRDWPHFLEDFHHHWPTDQPDTTVEMVRRGERGQGPDRGGSARWRRPAEKRGRAKSVFHFDVPGSVAKSTHAGLPWLLHLRLEMGERLHFWPFDGWNPAAGISVIAEAYPSLWNDHHARGECTPDQHDAFTLATKFRNADASGKMENWWRHKMKKAGDHRARYEGWIFGLA